MKRLPHHTITEFTLRALVRNILESHSGGDVWEPNDKFTKISAVVDPQADDTYPINPDYTPQDKIEFGVAVKNLVKNIPDEKMSNIFNFVKDAIALDKKRTEKDIVMKEKNVKHNVVEAALRKEIRRQLQEMGPGGAYRGMDFYGEKEKEVEKDPQRRRHTTMGDVGGANFAEIATELGLSVAGAKQLVDKTLARAKLVGTMDQDDLEIMALTAVKDYIKHLRRSGELSAADIQLMLDHPDIIRELDGFREFLHRYIRRAHKQHKTFDELDPEGRVKGHGFEVEDA